MVLVSERYPTDRSSQDWFQGFSNDLSVGVLNSGDSGEPQSPPLTANAPAAGYVVLYARNDFRSTSVEEELYRPFFTNSMMFNRSNEEFASSREVNDQERHGQVPVFAGGGPGFGSLLFEANDDLTAVDNPFHSALNTRVKAEISAGEDNDYPV